MNATRGSILPILALVLLSSVLVTAQQPNSLGGSLVMNNVDGPTYPNIVPVLSPGTMIAVLSGEPAAPFMLVAGPLLAGTVPVAGVGMFDLNIAQVQILMNGFNPATALGLFARTDPETGEATIAAPIQPGVSGPGLAFQAILVDPASAVGFTLTAASQMDFQTGSGSGGGPSFLTSMSSMSGGGGNLLYELRVPIDAIGASSVTVLQNVVVDVLASTNIRTASGGSMPFSNLAQNDFAKVEAFIDSASGALQAHQIRLESPQAGYDVKVEGAVDAATATDVSFLGVTFTAVPGSDINLAGGLAGLVAGDFVEIKANLVSGSYEIVEIHTSNPMMGAFDTSFRARSLVTQASATSISVLGVTVMIGTGVRLDGISSVASLTSADYVEVRANPDLSGTLWAQRIKMLSVSPDVRIKGPISALTSPGFAIFTGDVVTTPSTQWRDGLTSFSSLTMGLRVEVKGTWDGTVVTATEVGLDDV